MYRPWSLPDNMFMPEHTFDKEPSLENYISYYVKLWKEIEGKYQSLLDFSNSEQQLTEEFMLSIKDELLKHFDIKVVMMLRDPIRRLWSVCNRKSLTEGGTPQSHMKFDDPNLSYVDKYKKYVRVWGEDNVKVIINEEFYAGHTYPLSYFLEYDIKPRYSKIARLSKMKDDLYSQWCDLDKDTWKLAYDNMKWIYDEYDNVPKAWKDRLFYK